MRASTDTLTKWQNYKLFNTYLFEMFVRHLNDKGTIFRLINYHNGDSV